jgi:LysM repeat protein
MKFVRRIRFPKLCSSFLLVFSLLGCVASPPNTTPTATRDIQLIPYKSPTPSQLSSNKTPQVITPTSPPTPTPTPITYSVIEGDTMLAIALRQGITLEELLAANPEVNPRLLSVGTELVIPLGESIPSAPMTPTPLPLMTKPPDCYQAPDGKWCFLLVKNDRARPLENISAQIIMFDSSGEAITTGIAISPLNQLRVSESIPLVLFLPGELTSETTTVAELVTAQFIPRGDERYLNAWVEVDLVELSETGKLAQIVGSYGIPKKSAAAGQVWIVATAFDQFGKVVGFKKLEFSDQLEPGAHREFALEVFSLGSEINEVKVLVEARPVVETEQIEDSP